MTDSTKKIAFFDRLAHDWCDEHIDERLAKECLSIGLSGQARILDMGCGIGTSTSILANYVFPDSSIVAVDFSKTMLEKAAANRDCNLIDFVCCDITHLPFRSNYFDGVLAYQCLPHIFDRELLFEEIHLALRPGGKMMVLHFASSNILNEMHSKLDSAVARDMLPKIDILAQTARSKGFLVIDSVEREDLYKLIIEKPQ